MNGLFKTKEKTVCKVVMLDIASIVPNRAQPRTEFSDAAIKSLAESIRENGILQPLCVRKRGALYELISGERRLRAAKLLELSEVPCIIMDVCDEQSAVLAIIENIQRKDLSFFEEALAIEKLITVYGMTQEAAAARLGKAQSTIANKLRLLRFTDTERAMLISGNLSERQARALIRIADEGQRKAALSRVISKKLNLEQTEQLVSDMLDENKLPHKKPAPRKLSEQRLKAMLPAPPRLYMNSINQLIRRMKESNVPCVTAANKVDGYYEYIIRFPIANE